MKVFDAIKKHDTKGLIYKYLETIINETTISSEEKTSDVSEPQNKKKKVLEAPISPLVKDSIENVNSNKIVNKYLYIAQPTGRTDKELLNELLAKTGSLNEVSDTKDKLGNRSLRFNSGTDLYNALQKLKSFDETKLVGRYIHLK